VIVRGRNAICVAAAVILAACGAHAQSQNPQQVRLALSLAPGTTYRYTVHTSGSMKSAQPGMAMTMSMDISMRQTYEVLSVDPAGVATVKVTVDQLAGKLGTTSLPIPGSIPAFTVQIAKDGTVNGLGEDQLGSMQAGLPFANPGPLGGIVPVLPAGSVKPGDHWTKETNIPGPSGGSAGQITWDNQLLRFESLNGERVAVIESRFKAPMDTSLDANQIAQAEASASPPPGMPTPPPGFSPPPGASGLSLPPGFNPVVHLQGTTTGTMTSWVAVSTGRLVKASGTSSSTMSESVQGLPSPAPGAFGLGTGSSQMTETQSIAVSPAS